jgi:two-component system KDP operon response regulator KdpE
LASRASDREPTESPPLPAAMAGGPPEAQDEGFMTDTALTGPILVVEDDPGIATMLDLALGERGDRSVHAATLDEALTALARERPVLVLLDVRLHGADGLALAGAFRDAGVPIIVMTASQDAQTAAQSIAADAWLGKPFDLDTLYALVDRFGRRAPPREAGGG